MARFLALVCTLGGVFATSALAAAPATNAAPGATAMPGQTPVPPPPDEFVRYGKILAPNDQAPYPFKLNMPNPGFGEMKIPRPEELAMRTKLEQLAMLSDAEIRDQLAKWPPYTKMSLGDQGMMLTRIQQFRDRRDKTAATKAHQLGLLTLNPQQQARFEQEYWNKRLAMDRQLAHQFDPVYHAAEQKLNEDLYREFSSPGGLGQPPKPPASPSLPPPAAAAH